MSPSPVGVDDDGALDFGAAAGSALGPVEGGMVLGGVGADLLGAGGGDQRRGCGNGAQHG